MYLNSKQFNKLSFLVIFKPFLEDSYKLCEKDMYKLCLWYASTALFRVFCGFCRSNSSTDPLKQKCLVSLGEKVKESFLFAGLNLEKSTTFRLKEMSFEKSVFRKKSLLGSVF